MVSSYARTKEASQAKCISILNIIQGEVDPTQVILIGSSVELSERDLCSIIQCKKMWTYQNIAVAITANYTSNTSFNKRGETL